MSNRIYYLFVAFFLYGTFVFGAHFFFGIGDLDWQRKTEAIAVFLFFGVFALLNISGRVIMTGGSLLAGFIFSWIYGLSKMGRIFYEYRMWLTSAEETDYILFCCFVQFVLMGLIAFALAYIYTRGFICKLILFSSSVFISLYLVIKGYYIPKTGIAFLFSFFLLFFIELVEFVWKKQKNSNKDPEYFYMLWPFFCVFLIVMMFAPVSNKPYDWGTPKRIISQISEKMTNVSEHFKGLWKEDFGISMAGFSSDGKLGKNVNSNDKILFNVKTSRGLYTNLFLSGKTYDSFDGRQWEASDNSYINSSIEKKIDTLETLCATNTTGIDLKRYMYSVDFTMTYKYYHSKFYFYPSKMAAFSSDYSDLYNDNEKAQKEKGKTKSFGDSYNVRFYQLNQGKGVLSEVIYNSGEIDRKMWSKNSLSVFKEDIPFDELDKYRETIKAVYLPGPQLSDRAKEWLDDTVSEADDDFSKLVLLERRLSEMKYTLSPGEIPKGVNDQSDFIDYFLFEKKEGFCTYYATTFTLLARSLGMPTRYVEGFCVPMKNKSEADILGSMAHAWPEVYFEGIGWVPFEPTPGFGKLRYDSWDVVPLSELTNGKPTLTYPEFGNNHEEEMMDMTDMYAEEVPEETKEKVKIRFELIAISVGTVLAVTLFIVFVKNIIHVFIYKRKSFEEKYNWEIDRFFWVLSKMGLKRREEETLQEFKKRIENDLSDGIKVDFIDFYEEYRYGNKIPERKVLITLLEERKGFYDRLKGISRISEFINNLLYRVIKI